MATGGNDAVDNDEDDEEDDRDGMQAHTNHDDGVDEIC